jgi:hypothetical protein
MSAVGNRVTDAVAFSDAGSFTGAAAFAGAAALALAGARVVFAGDFVVFLTVIAQCPFLHPLET